MTHVEKLLHAGGRSFDALELTHYWRAYNINVPTRETRDWQSAGLTPYPWNTARSEKVEAEETLVLLNLRAHTDAGVDPLDFRITLDVSGKRLLEGPLFALLKVDFIDPFVVDEQELVTFGVQAQRLYEKDLRMQFIFSGYRKKVVR